MTEDELYLLLIRLKCCSANYADTISTKLQYGACDESIKLIMLNGLIELLLDWNIEDTTINCMTEEQFDEAVIKAKNICSLCDCN
jgi:response regulator of citrate/malate metabolism